jgi:hypothetical protein
MKKSNSIVLFNQKQVRRFYDEDKELWYFSIIDVIEILVDASIPKRYWSDLKIKLKNEGSEVYEKIVQLKFVASDGKKYATDCFSAEVLLRVIQSIPSPKAEPFKLWLAKVGYERMEEMEDPELSFDRAMKTYLQKGYSEKWVNQRLKSIEVRKDLIAEWGNRGIKENSDYAILTDEITKAWADRSVKDYKKFKGLKKENLRDNMTNLELVLNMLAEESTTEISKKKKPKGLENNKQIAKEGGLAAKAARMVIEKQTGESVITSRNAKVLQNKHKLSLSDKDKK